MNEAAFSSLNLKPALQENLASLGYLSMTPIQAQSLPPVLEGKDVIAQGKTGSGKTAAFGLGLLQKLNVKRYSVQSLVLCPTRELADQVSKEIRRLGRSVENVKVLTLCGGVPMGPQINSLEHGAHIVVGTPGRIEDLLRKNFLKLENVTTLVLDEADRMLDMGFQETLETIIEYTPRQRQTLLFSATFPDKIQAISKNIMLDPVLVQVESNHDSSTIQQYFYKIHGERERHEALRLLLLHHRPGSSLVFCNTRRECQEVADELSNVGFSALAIHGELEQKDRDQALIQFANKSVSVLVATDVAARGLDIDALDAVFNFHLAHDQEMHIHRIGRTGRAGNKGIACTLYSEKERHKVARLEVYLNQDIVTSLLPEENLLDRTTYKPPMATLQIDGGRKQKIRPGDILGALTGNNGLAGKDVGKIDIFDNWSFVAVRRGEVKQALRKIGQGKMKSRSFRVRQIGS